MREIKFRGKSINGDWHYGLLSISQGIKAGHQPEAGYYISNRAGQPWAFQVRPETVGQYTERKDKNGKEIYERDIAYAPIIKGKYIVKFGLYACEHNDTLDREPTDCGFYIERYDDKFHKKTECQEGLGESEEYLEIIGNLDDNPELLITEVDDAKKM